MNRFEMSADFAFEFATKFRDERGKKRGSIVAAVRSGLESVRMHKGEKFTGTVIVFVLYPVDMYDMMREMGIPVSFDQNANCL